MAASPAIPDGWSGTAELGRLDWDGVSLAVAEIVKGENGSVGLLPKSVETLPPIGQTGTQRIECARRFAHMRMHTALHPLSVVIPLPVTGGRITAAKGRLAFHMADPPGEKDDPRAGLQARIDRDLEVGDLWITEADLAARPELVKTLPVALPKEQGPVRFVRVRFVRIGPAAAPFDLQPCGATHFERIAEIGLVRIGKI